MATCKGCNRSEWWDRNGKRSTRVNRDGLCPVCVEVNAEAAADDREKKEAGHV